MLKICWVREFSKLFTNQDKAENHQMTLAVEKINEDGSINWMDKLYC